MINDMREIRLSSKYQSIILHDKFSVPLKFFNVFNLAHDCSFSNIKLLNYAAKFGSGEVREQVYAAGMRPSKPTRMYSRRLAYGLHHFQTFQTI